MMLSALLKPAIVVNGKKYKIMNQIGEGAFGYVYHVKSVHVNDKGESYALKKLICQTEEQLNEAKREMDVMLKVKHAHIVPLLSFSYLKNKKGQNEVYMVMPMYQTSVQAVIDSGGGYPHCALYDGLDVVTILRHSLEGLLALHEAGFRHGDFKPANILLTESFEAVITDFGSTAALSTIVSSRSEALRVQEYAESHCTASYRAPELFSTPNDCIIDNKADVWAFGCTMYCLMYSRTPFETTIEGLSTLSVMSSQYSIPDDSLWPDEYLEVVKQCLIVDPSKRISPHELQVKLKRLPGPPLDLHKKVKATKTDEFIQSSSQESPNTTDDNEVGRSPSEETSPMVTVIGDRLRFVPTIAGDMIEIPVHALEAPAFQKSLHFSVDFAEFEDSASDNVETVMEVINVENFLMEYGARGSSIGELESSSLSLGSRGDIWGVTTAKLTNSMISSNEPQNSNAINEVAADGVDPYTESPIHVDENKQSDAGSSFESVHVHSSAASFAVSDVCSSLERRSQQDCEDIAEEEFGDFSSDYAQSMAEGIAMDSFGDVPTLQQPSTEPLPTPLDNNVNCINTSYLNIANNIKAIDFYQQIIDENTDPEKIIREGRVFMMRLGGFPKKRMRKEVLMVVTSSGLLIRKEGSSKDVIKVHEILSFHQPLSLTPTDTLSVGLNGLLLNGFSPLSLASNIPSYPSTPSSTTTTGEDNDWVHVDLSPKCSSAAMTAASPSSTRSLQRVKSRFVSCRVEIAFPSKEELNEWMDTIWQQYELIRGVL